MDEAIKKHFTLKELKKLARSETSRNSIILFVSNAINSIVSIAVAIIVSRALGPEKFGILATYSAVWITLIGLTDFGLGTTAIKYITASRKEAPGRASIYMKVVFKLEVLCGILIGLVGLFFSAQIASLLGGQHLHFAVKMAFLAGVFGSVGAFVTPFLVSFNRYFAIAAIQTAGAVSRLVGVLLLLAYGLTDTNPLIILYTAIPLIVLAAGLFVVPRDYLAPASEDRQKAALREILNFSKWIFLSYLATVTISRADVFIISRYRGSTEVGLYAAAQQLSTLVPLLLGAISTVLLPVVSPLSKKSEFKSYLIRITPGLVFLAFCMIPVIIFGDVFIGLIFGDRFAQSIGAFRVLLAAYLLPLVFNPWGLIIYAIDKPRAGAIINYAQLIVSISLSLILVPKLGFIGAAYSFLVTTTLGTVAIVWYLVRTLKKLPE